MENKKLITPILIIGLSAAFAIIALAVYLTRGKSKFWIGKKMLVGSLLLSLNSVATQSCVTSCYDPVVPNHIELDRDDDDYSSTININLEENNKITGTLYDRSGTDFSFSISDTLETDTLQVGDIIPTDGEFDSSTEEIYLEIDQTLPKKEYILSVYSAKQDEQESPINAYRIKLQ
ncbi:MAG: hypothetical protein ACK5LR_10045 [Mangrovibacterium sp.]